MIKLGETREKEERYYISRKAHQATYPDRICLRSLPFKLKRILFPAH